MFPLKKKPLKKEAVGLSIYHWYLSHSFESSEPWVLLLQGSDLLVQSAENIEQQLRLAPCSPLICSRLDFCTMERRTNITYRHVSVNMFITLIPICKKHTTYTKHPRRLKVFEWHVYFILDKIQFTVPNFSPSLNWLNWTWSMGYPKKFTLGTMNIQELKTSKIILKSSKIYSFLWISGTFIGTPLTKNISFKSVVQWNCISVRLSFWSHGLANPSQHAFLLSLAQHAPPAFSALARLHQLRGKHLEKKPRKPTIS